MHPLQHSLVADHLRASGDLDTYRASAGQFGTAGRNNHEIEWRSDGRQLNPVEGDRIAIQILQEVTAGARLARSRIAPQERRPGAIPT